MEQQQIHVSFSVGTKLLVSIVSLLIIVIIFLNISAIVLFREDKRAYTYQAQSTGAVLAGREFVLMAKHALETLRNSMAAVDPRIPLTPQQGTALQTIVDNQLEMVSLSIYWVNIQKGSSELYAQTSKDKEIKELAIQPQDYKIAPEFMTFLIPELMQKSYAFFNISQLGGAPVLGVLFADRNLEKEMESIPIAVGLVSLRDFGKNLNNLKLTVATRSGWTLFDPDPTAFFSKEKITEEPLLKLAAASQLDIGAQEYDSNGVHYLGSYVLPGLDLVVLTKMEWEKAMKATYVLVEKFALLGIMAIGAAVIFGILFSKTLTAPLARLYEATKEVAKGNFLLELDERGRDEIGALSQSFNTMSKKIGELIQESIEKTHLENELAIASTVQQTLIPPEDFSNQWLRIFSHYQAASKCGGDWWGFFGVDNKIALMIADATGHGLPSALMTASARSCFSVMHKLAQEDPEFSFSPSAMLSYANRVIFDASMGKIMMTFFVAVIDMNTKTLTYSNAGHNPQWLFKKEGGKYKLHSLTVPGQRLGEGKESVQFEEKSIAIDSEDILFIYTDGLMEGKDRAGVQFGKKRVRKVIESNLSGGPKKVVTALLKDFLNHNDGKPLDDDVTIATAMILGSGVANTMHAKA